MVSPLPCPERRALAATFPDNVLMRGQSALVNTAELGRRGLTCPIAETTLGEATQATPKVRAALGAPVHRFEEALSGATTSYEVQECVKRKAFRFQLRTRPALEAQLRRFAGMERWIWCRALAEQRARHARGEKYAGYVEMCRWLTAWRNAFETRWLAEGPAAAQQHVLRRLDEAYKRFFAGLKEGRRVGSPKFKHRGQESGIRFPNPKGFRLDAANARLKLPKLGWVRLRMSRQVEGTLRNVSVTRDGARWFVSLQVEQSDIAPALDVAPTLGIDLGLTKFAAFSEEVSCTSDGSKASQHYVEPLKALAKHQRRLRYAQRAVSRKKKGSANRRKAVDRLGRLYRRIARQRSDWLHKLTTDLANGHAVVALEDLCPSNMTASARGTAEAPGKNVRSKAGLNRAILDAAWGAFARQLAYKLRWRGGRVILVNPAYTSRTCRLCDYESKDNRKSQALFQCVACGHTENADVHAAKNILAAGHAVWAQERASHAVPPAACGGDDRRNAHANTRRAAPMKQESTEARGLV